MAPDFAGVTEPRILILSPFSGSVRLTVAVTVYFLARSAVSAVWAWLLGPFVRAHYKVYRDRAAARLMLAPLADHLGDFGVGSIAEVFDADPPFLPGGCIAQAWSVSETLRAWVEIETIR